MRAVGQDSRSYNKRELLAAHSKPVPAPPPVGAVCALDGVEVARLSVVSVSHWRLAGRLVETYSIVVDRDDGQYVFQQTEWEDRVFESDTRAHEEKKLLAKGSQKDNNNG